MKNDGAKMLYPGSSILRSTATQLSVELRKHYKNGSKDLCEKAEAPKRKGLLPTDVVVSIDHNISAIENFIHLNKVCMSRRRLAPMSSFEDSFISLSELELTRFFCQDEVSKQQLQDYASPDFPNAENISQTDVAYWLSKKDPGHLITKLVTDVGSYQLEERRRLKEYRAKTSVMPLDKMKQHIRAIRDDSFEPMSYKERDHVLRGSIRTDGFRLQLTAFKLNELNAVKYRRLPVEKLPPRITSTLAGTDYFLTEIRNIVKIKQDVSDLWDCDPERIKVLGLDLGQAFVIGASALLPNSDIGKGTNAVVKKQSEAVILTGQNILAG
ncbi:hypothetical protein EDD21DRAFT_437411 [Dissophora ornata]|nr:hypothetical protein EDD21DRAFT_437411 [Dissophora ornata]